MCKSYELAIIGLGPAGLGFVKALQNTELLSNTICFERGNSLDNKQCTLINEEVCSNDPFCNIISGIGGASILSNCKISCYPAGSGLLRFFSDDENQLLSLMKKEIDLLIEKAGLNKIEIDKGDIEKSALFFESRNIIYKYYDVYELNERKYNDYLREIIALLVDNGLNLLTNSNVKSITYNKSTFDYTITVGAGDSTSEYQAKKIVIAEGSSDIHTDLLSEYPRNTTYEIGLRIEGESDLLNTALNSHGDLKLKYNNGRTYCVTKNGVIISYNTSDYHFLEGAKKSSDHNQYTNFAVLINSVSTTDVKCFLRRYKQLTNGKPIKQSFSDYLSLKTSNDSLFTTIKMAEANDINLLFSNDINRELKEFIIHVVINTMGISQESITLVAPELKISRSYGNLNNNFELQNNLYVIGAATGCFRGILQAFCSGVKCACNILE
jgi:uncharacterized FAD-dependent dehydrogenase